MHMLGHIVLAVPVMFWVLPRLIRSMNICKLSQLMYHLCVSVDGMLVAETESFVKRLSDFLTARWL